MRITDYMPGDEKHILHLFEKSFHRKLNEEFWKWRFIDNPINKQYIKLCWMEEELVGHYAVCPVKAMVYNEDAFAFLSMTTMTHPGHAGKGIFKMLATSLYNDLREDGKNKLVYGFPNANSHYGFIKNLNWKDLFILPTLSLALPNYKPTTETKTIAVSDENNFDKYYSENSYKFKLNRSEEYLKWRYVNNPTNTYNFFEFSSGSEVYYAVTKMFDSFEEHGKKEVDILELACPDEFSILQDFLSAIYIYYKESKPFRLNIWMPLANPKYLLLEKLGFIHKMPLTYFGAMGVNNVEDLIYSPHDWYISMGDSDIY